MKLFNDFSANEIFWVISLGSQAIMFFWLAPLRKAQKRITILERRVEESNLTQLRTEIETEQRRAKECAARCDRSVNDLAHEIEKIQQDRRESVSKLHSKIDLLSEATNKGFRDIERAIGKLEGKTE